MNTGVVGIGSMGGMLIRAFLRSEALAPKDIWATNRSPQKLDALLADFPGIHVASRSQLAARCDLIFLCVGTADTATALAMMEAELHSGQLLVSTAAAVPMKILESRVPCRVAKLIPSVTQEIGSGIALLLYGSRVTTDDRKLLEDLLGRIRQPVAITESLARPAIGLTSGGPALLAYLLQSMVEQAVQSNPELSPELAGKLVKETAGATMRLITEANMASEEIIRRVAVPGGMTALAVEILSRYVPEAWKTVFRETAEREARASESLVL
ncbi:MAG TPA: NAD(P)-binding domain-containing protein [Terriglobales bacterium]|nr:NAD(P)-binding domain-containing protein [Terriglobales bacterium]